MHFHPDEPQARRRLCVFNTEGDEIIQAPFIRSKGRRCNPCYFRCQQDRVLLPSPDETDYSSTSLICHAVEQYTFVYANNDGIGCFGLCPLASAMGYHKKDVEMIQVYYSSHAGDFNHHGHRISDSEDHPSWVYFSQHGGKKRGGGQWVSANELDYDKESKTLHVYVAKGSHACYPHGSNPRRHLRIFGLANDLVDPDVDSSCMVRIDQYIDGEYVKQLKNNPLDSDIPRIQKGTMRKWERFCIPISFLWWR